ncbi:MAG: hypothetical protein J2P57_01920, partial [Acidimicrobiaceae bacterium]|nr:hypothetical protein [Acidimicrobiaceae bacterium]
GPGTGVAFEEAARRHGDFAMVGAAASVRVEGGTYTDARLVLMGVSDIPVRCRDAEQVLLSAPSGGGVADEAAALAAESISPPSDLHGTSAYRKHLARVLLRRAITRATAGGIK